MTTDQYSGSSTIMSDLINQSVLEKKKLHPYQLKAIMGLFKRVFLTVASNRPQAKEIVNDLFHKCLGQ